MRNFFKIVWTALCLCVLVLFLISCCSAYIPPERFSFIVLLAVAFPYLFLSVAVCAVLSFMVNRRLAIVLLLSLLAGYSNLTRTVAFNTSRPWQAQQNDSTLRVLTWNVQYFGNLVENAVLTKNMIALVHEYEPGLVCMQEFSNTEYGSARTSVRKQMDSLGYKYHFFSNDHLVLPKNAVITFGVAVFSKFPFTDSARININREPMNENLVYTSILFNNKPLRIYTAHLASFDLYNDTTATKKDIYEITYDRKRAIQYKLRETEQVHQKEVGIISNAIAQSPYPVVYCGDLNTVPCSYNYRYLRNNFNDAFLEKGSGIGATFYKILPTLRIDACFTDTAFKIGQCMVVKRRLSDHYPLVTDISWK